MWTVARVKLEFISNCLGGPGGCQASSDYGEELILARLRRRAGLNFDAEPKTIKDTAMPYQ